MLANSVLMLVAEKTELREVNELAPCHRVSRHQSEDLNPGRFISLHDSMKDHTNCSLCEWPLLYVCASHDSGSI
jgi:hypothetical protein